ncbi:MAG TPA: helix-turn-helix transcriptional regulator [Candidatus Pygmaiobacter gallistercoris]|nr:helix-turn-helix transcriptional regulator [Candidatus Pygmaiobacter gallistercoris]
MPLGNRLREQRARLGLNQQQLGQLVGASRQTISLIERGDYHPSVLLALRIARVFDLPLEEIFFLEGEDGNETKE